MASIHAVNVSKRFGSPRDLSLRDKQRQRQISGFAPREGGSDEPPPEGSVLALDRASLAVRDGESMVIVGSSGCGKTTLLRVIAGLESYDEGEVRYGDQDMRDVPPKDRGIGIVFQTYALYPQYESKGNLSFFFRMHKRESEINERVRQTSEIMGIGFDQLLDRKPEVLSGGQKQRVAIARAICRDPRLLLFDEPLSNLDAQLRSTTRIEIRRLINRFRITTLYVTHDQAEATIMGDRLAIMDKGRVVQVGTFRDVYDQPINAYVAGFLGSPPMNLFDGFVEHGGVRALGIWVPMAPRVRDLVVEGQVVRVGVRPEHIEALDATADRSTCVMDAVVEHVERLPSERIQLLYANLAGQRIVVRAPIDRPIAWDQRVALRIDPAQLQIFDARSGVRL
jgi:ABC-type sugar transport system ATPase subunit